MSNEVALVNQSGETLEEVLIKGDLSGLTSEQCVVYYKKVCDSVRLNPLTRPFDYITFQGKKILYALKGCAEQLRQIHKVSIDDVQPNQVGDIYIVKALASKPDGRKDSAIGAVNIAGVKGNDLGIALMKAETKAKRRVTLSICGLSMLDESDLEEIPRDSFQRFEDKKLTETDKAKQDETPILKAIEQAQKENLIVYRVPIEKATVDMDRWFEKRSAKKGPTKGTYLSDTIIPKAEQYRIKEPLKANEEISDELSKKAEEANL